MVKLFASRKKLQEYVFKEMGLKLKKTTILIESSYLKWLKQHAIEQETSMGDIVRRAVADYHAKHGN